MKEFCIILAGNPNVGKTSLFNALTHSDARVGNWHGVTVQARQAYFDCEGCRVHVVDLPGAYSLDAYSEEERVTADYISGGAYDLIVGVGDSGAFYRFLPFAAQLAACKKPMLCVWNMWDELQKRKGRIDLHGFYAATGVPAVDACATDKKSVARLKKAIIALLLAPRPPQKQLSRQQWVQAAKRALLQPPLPPDYALDKWLLRPTICLLLFFLTLAVALYITFAEGCIGAMASDMLQALFDGGLGGLIRKMRLPAPLKGVLADGICRGVGSVLSFLPQIALLEFFLAIAEQTGFMARVAFLTDGLLNKIGLNGRAAFTVLTGLGCTATAAVTARGSENDVQRKKTVLLLPFVPCSARVPVFMVLIQRFFPCGAVWILFCVYFVSFIGVAVMGTLLHRWIYRGEAPLIMEMPPYRLPNLKKTAKLLLKSGKQFIIKVGTVIAVCMTVLWALQSFTPRLTYLPSGQIEGSLLQLLGKLLLPLFRPMGATDWRIPVAALSGLAAKEAVCGTLALVYPEGLTLSPATAAAFLVFVAWCPPCLSAICAIFREVGFGATAVSITVQTALSFLCAYLVHAAWGLGGTALGIAAAAAVLSLLLVAGFTIKRKSRCACCGVCKTKHARISRTTRAKPR